MAASGLQADARSVRFLSWRASLQVSLSLLDSHFISSQHYLTNHDLDTRSTTVLDCYVPLHGDVPRDVYRHLVHFEVVLPKARSISTSKCLEDCSALVLDHSFGPIPHNPDSQTDGLEMLLPTFGRTSFETL